MFPRSDLRYIDERWHQKNRDAKRTTSSLDEWSDRETKRWDLDTDSRRPTGQENPRTWQFTKPLRRVNQSENEPTADVRAAEVINDR